MPVAITKLVHRRLSLNCQYAPVLFAPCRDNMRGMREGSVGKVVKRLKEAPQKEVGLVEPHVNLSQMPVVIQALLRVAEAVKGKLHISNKKQF